MTPSDHWKPSEGWKAIHGLTHGQKLLIESCIGEARREAMEDAARIASDLSASALRSGRIDLAAACVQIAEAIREEARK